MVVVWWQFVLTILHIVSVHMHNIAHSVHELASLSSEILFALNPNLNITDRSC